MVSLRLVAVIIVAACGPFQFGYNTGVINAPANIIKNYLNETSIAQTGEPYLEKDLIIAWSVVVAIFPVGGMIGSFGVGFGANFLGRRMFMFVLSIGGVISGIILGLSKVANSYAMLVIGRLLVGVVSGAYTGLTPMYLSEVAPVAIRGSIGVVNQLAIVIALLLSQVFGLQELLGTPDYWPLLLGLTAVPAAIQTILVLFICPESPRYLLITKSDEAAARRTLRTLSGAKSERELTALIDEMNREAEEQRREKTLSIIGLFGRKELRWPLLIAVVMQLSQQLSGINGIFYYSTVLFEGAGLSPEKAATATLGVGAVMVVATIISIPLIDRVGRKILHSIGLGGMMCAAVAMTVFLGLKPQFPWAGYVGIAFSFIFVMFFGIGPGSIPWLITAELFAQSSRPPAIVIATFVNWSANFVVGMAFEPIRASIEQYVFVVFAVLLLCFFVFTLKFVPETKGKTFQEIAAFFSKDAASADSPRPPTLADEIDNDYQYQKGNNIEDSAGTIGNGSKSAASDRYLLPPAKSSVPLSHSNGKGDAPTNNYLSITQI